MFISSGKRRLTRLVSPRWALMYVGIFSRGVANSSFSFSRTCTNPLSDGNIKHPQKFLTCYTSFVYATALIDVAFYLKVTFKLNFFYFFKFSLKLDGGDRM